MKLSVGVALALIAGCHVGEDTHETVTVATPTVPEIRTCSSPFVLPDLSTLTACGAGRGKGHCYEASKAPISAKEVPACDADGEICVPDKILLANGQKMTSCQFLGGNVAGACASLIQNELYDHKDQVTQENCDADERCTPCIDPRTGDDSGTCDPTGVHEKACVGGEGSAGETCCHAMGVCMDKDAVPSDSQDDMNRDTCSDAKQVCAPLSMSDGAPTKCSLLGLSGVCLDVCFAQILQGAQRTARADCGPTELCLPCVIGKSKGIPGCD